MKKDLFTLQSMALEEIEQLLEEGEQFAAGKIWQVPKQTFVANLFFEPSTRTRYSFEIAEKALGLDVLSFSKEGSSVEKGESLIDTVKTFEALGAQLLVIRHQMNEFYNQISPHVQLPIINAGDGSGHHPTQSLLDLLTIKQEFSSFDHLNVVIVGDLQHSRVARSNADVLSRLGAKVMIAGPKEWLAGYPYERVQLDHVLPETDVLMMLRIQHERHEQKEEWSLSTYHSTYGFTKKRDEMMKPTGILLHPGPVNRGVEIASPLVYCARSRIIKQMENGVAIRKAVIKRALQLESGI